MRFPFYWPSWLRRTVAVIGVILAVLGLADVPSHLRSWWRFLGTGQAQTLVVAVGVLLVVSAVGARRRESSLTPAETATLAAPLVPAPPPAEKSVKTPMSEGALHAARAAIRRKPAEVDTAVMVYSLRQLRREGAALLERIRNEQNENVSHGKEISTWKTSIKTTLGPEHQFYANPLDFPIKIPTLSGLASVKAHEEVQLERALRVVDDLIARFDEDGNDPVDP